MGNLCDTCFHTNSVQSAVSTTHCARCCAFNAWEPLRTETKDESCFHPLTVPVKATVAASPDANVEAIREMLLQRSKVGLAKYGVTTERTDLTLVQWLTHLQEELLDGAVYVEAALRQIQEE